MFIELIKRTLTNHRWRETEYRHESGTILKVCVPPCYRKKDYALTFNEAAEAKMLLGMTRNLPNKPNKADQVKTGPRLGVAAVLGSDALERKGW